MEDVALCEAHGLFNVLGCQHLPMQYQFFEIGRELGECIDDRISKGIPLGSACIFLIRTVLDKDRHDMLSRWLKWDQLSMD